MKKIGNIEFETEELLDSKTLCFVDDNEDLITREELVVDSKEYGLVFIKVDYKNRNKEVGHFIEYADGTIEKTGTYAKSQQNCQEEQPQA